MANIKKIAKTAADAYMFPFRLVNSTIRNIGGIVGAGNRNVNPVYRQMIDLINVMSSEPPLGKQISRGGRQISRGKKAVFKPSSRPNN